MLVNLLVNTRVTFANLAQLFLGLSEDNYYICLYTEFKLNTSADANLILSKGHANNPNKGHSHKNVNNLLFKGVRIDLVNFTYLRLF